MVLLHPDYLLKIIPPKPHNRFEERSPLRNNAFAFMRAGYASLGLAATPIKTLKKSIVIRIVWVYPKYRKEKRIRHYLAVGSVSFPLEVPCEDKIPNGKFRKAYYSEISSQMIEYIDQNHLSAPENLFSELGKKEIVAALCAPFSGGHPRTLARKKRLRRIAELKDLRNRPQKIVDLLRSEGLYSKKVPGYQQLWHVEGMVKELRNS